MLRAEHQDARSEHRTARTLFEGDLLLSVNDETRQGALRFWNNDGDALAPSETGGPREVTIQSRIHSNDEQLLGIRHCAASRSKRTMTSHSRLAPAGCNLRMVMYL